MGSMKMNVDDYLARIKYTGSRKPTVENLGALSLAHKTQVPYTSMDIHGGNRIVLKLDVIYKKVVTNKGGGICYELNGLFMWLLQELGYEVHFGQSAFFNPATDGFTIPYYHVLIFAKIDGEYYIPDPGWTIVGPMKVKHMEPHIETHAMYRARNIPGEEDCWYYIERHKKTVLDVDGKVLKQGPAPPGIPTGYCDEECAKEESSHWAPLFRMSMEPKKLEDFIECCDHHQDNKQGLLRTLLVMHRFEPDRFIVTFGEKVTVKKSLDPNTDKILLDVTLRNDDEVHKACKEHYNYEVKHRINFFSNKTQANGF